MMESNRITFRGKKSFTLLEVVISITIFMIVLLFLYETLDQTKSSNKMFNKRQDNIVSLNHLNNIITEDVAESRTIDEITLDDNKNARVLMVSNNTYHNAFYTNITYLISSNNKLVRIESLDKFKFGSTNYEFYENAFVDVLLEDIEFFEVSNLAFIIKQKNKEKIVIKAFKLK